MNKHFSPRFAAYLALTLVSCVFAAVVRRVELAMLGVPFTVALVAGLLGDRPPALRFTHRVSGTALFEGDLVDVEFSVHAETPLPIAEVVDPLPVGASLSSGTNSGLFSLEQGSTQLVRYQLRVDRRSRFTLGRLFYRIHDPSALTFWEGEWADPKVCVAYPRLEALTRPIRPFHTQVNVGNYPSREESEGIEFASQREYALGDRLRTINWRASQRTGRMFVNQYTRERNADVVLLIDTFVDAGPFGDSVLDRAARLAATLSSYFLQGNNRVEFIEFSGIVKWVSPYLGARQKYRILENLTDVRARESDVGRDITKVPRQILPPQALIVAFTPLVDERFTRTLLNLASRRYDIAAVLINPAVPLRKVLEGNLTNRTAGALWRLETDLASAELAEVGVPILSMEPDEPVELLAARLDALRQQRLVLQ